ncbi:hypothetical protein GMLC_30740 [Geomonas limicola]|uniref:Uncharacterized protein n=1 Tax=Geomonas limicola TaxID=2740186 RepID=A0A6V8NA60_9BACT|nr:hypothetical protein [Geomonas limicola]GFO69495.1 hypothetical protein GMLC_30740 [Geomonas limicola]
MGIFDLLAEARIREWQERSPEEKRQLAEHAVTITGDEPLEVQLFKEVIALRKAAQKEPESETKDAMLAKATKLQIQLMVVLEQSGRPLAAQKVAENIRLCLAEEG